MEIFSSEKKRRHDYFMKCIQKRADQMKMVHRIILIGTGESGKSTFVKQMKLLSSYNQTFSEAYRLKFVHEIYRNLVQSLYSITKFMEEENIAFRCNQNPPTSMSNILQGRNLMYELKTKIDINPDSIQAYLFSNKTAYTEFFDVCTMLWSDQAVKETCDQGYKFQLIDCAQYFLDKVNEISKNNYTPNDEDILRSRTKTLGIHTEAIIINNVYFEFIDVGGQREQRGKWIEAMTEGVTAVIFLTDASSYDMMLAEDSRVNRLRESISLLSQMWDKSPLSDKSIILFLNKQDKLEKKIRDQTSRLEDHFPEYIEAKVIFVLDLIEQFQIIRMTKPKNEAEFWEKHFGQFLPAINRTSRLLSSTIMKRTSKIVYQNKSSTASVNKDELQAITEMNQIQTLMNQVGASKQQIDDFGEISRIDLDELENNNDNDLLILDQSKKIIVDYLNEKIQLNVNKDKQVVSPVKATVLSQMLTESKQLNVIQKRLNSIALFEIVSITDFLQKLFTSNCEQTASRRIYTFPTTAIDRRNVSRIFDSCKDILQGKALTDFMN